MKNILIYDAVLILTVIILLRAVYFLMVLKADPINAVIPKLSYFAKMLKKSSSSENLKRLS
jgi:hypothetical protein